MLSCNKWERVTDRKEHVNSGIIVKEVVSGSTLKLSPSASASPFWNEGLIMQQFTFITRGLQAVA